MPSDKEIIFKKLPSFSKRDILSYPKIKSNPISIILLKKFTVDGKLDNTALITSLYQFSESKSSEDKLSFLFKLYNSKGDGYINNMELFEILKLLNKGILEDSKYSR